MDYEPVVTFNPHKPTATEKLLERRIENLQDRIRELEQTLPDIRSSEIDEKNLRPNTEILSLIPPMIKATEEVHSNGKGVISSSPIHQALVPLILVNRPEIRIFESVV